MAQFLFKEMLVELSNYDINKTKVYNDHILFENYVFGETMGLKDRVRVSLECYKFIQRLKRKNKINDYFVDGKYLGIRVLI